VRFNAGRPVSSYTRFKCINDPLRVIVAYRGRRKCDDIETYRNAIGKFVLLQVIARRSHKTVALPAIDAGDSTAEQIIAAVTNFDKNKSTAIAHDEINLAARAAVITLSELEPLSRQISACEIFGLSANA